MASKTPAPFRRSQPGDLFSRTIACDPTAARRVAKALGSAMDCASCTDGTQEQYDDIAALRDLLHDIADEAKVGGN